MHQLNLVFQIATATLLLLVCVLLAKHSRGGLHTWTGIALTLSIFCYVVIESETVQSFAVWRIAEAPVGLRLFPFQWEQLQQLR